jgi:hypothetical protein
MLPKERNNNQQSRIFPCCGFPSPPTVHDKRSLLARGLVDYLAGGATYIFSLFSSSVIFMICSGAPLVQSAVCRLVGAHGHTEWCRRLWFLHEWITGDRLPLPDVSGDLPYIDVFDVNKCVNIQCKAIGNRSAQDKTWRKSSFWSSFNPPLNSAHVLHCVKNGSWRGVCRCEDELGEF